MGDTSMMKKVPLHPRPLSAQEVAEQIRAMALLASTQLVVRYNAECSEGSVVQIRNEAGVIVLIID